MSATEVIRKAKNTFYINYAFDDIGQSNLTTGYTLEFPAPPLNIKANNAFISITNLAFYNHDANESMAKDLDAIVMKTNIPTSLAGTGGAMASSWMI